MHRSIPPAHFKAAQMADKTAYSLAVGAQTGRTEMRETMKALDVPQILNLWPSCRAEESLSNSSYAARKSAPGVQQLEKPKKCPLLLSDAVGSEHWPAREDPRGAATPSCFTDRLGRGSDPLCSMGNTHTHHITDVLTDSVGSTLVIDE